MMFNMIAESAFHFRPALAARERAGEQECTFVFKETGDRTTGNPISDPQLPDHGKEDGTRRRH